MSLEIEKFGKIKHAVIETKGLTVIAGHNDTGKSTIGKIFYTLIKSQVNFPELYDKLVNKKIALLLINPFFEFVNTLDDKSNDELIGRISDIRFRLFRLTTSEDGENDTIKDAFQIFEEYCKNHDVPSQIKERILHLKNEYEYCATDIEKFKMIAKHYFGSVFLNNLNNSVTREPARLRYLFNNSIISDIQINDDKITDVNFEHDKRYISYSDAVFIDTPMYLEKGHTSTTAFASDLKSKIQKALKTLENAQENDITLKINEILRGSKFGYNEKYDDLEYRVKKDAYGLKIANIASGSKSFGVLYLLIKTNVINKDTLIVLDEPENHLHPQWQIDYAEILADLVKDGYHIMLSSHSPTLIQALAFFARKKGIKKEAVNYYLAQKITGENYSNIQNVSDDIEKIFDNLNSPNDILYQW
ncbi:MAG: AAA family ATPase [Alphaproteobacteria bacterium]|nr:AAA family ATPase [Alphaproteobacteria bacterium]